MGKLRSRPNSLVARVLPLIVLWIEIGGTWHALCPMYILEYLRSPLKDTSCFPLRI